MKSKFVSYINSIGLMPGDGTRTGADMHARLNANMRPRLSIDSETGKKFSQVDTSVTKSERLSKLATPKASESCSSPKLSRKYRAKAKDGDSPFSRNANFSKGKEQGSSSSKMKTPSSKTKEPVDKKQQGGQRSARKSVVYEDMPPTPGEGSPNNTLTSEGRQMRGNRPSSRISTWFNPFKGQEKVEALMDTLKTYSNGNLPPMPELMALSMKQVDESVLQINGHWTELVPENESLSKKQRSQQEAIWELLATEVRYIQQLQIIIKLFYACLLNLQSEGLLNEIEIDKVFSNICDVYQANCVFWESYLMPVLQHSYQNKTLLDPSLMKEGFLLFDEIFLPYTRYCLDQEACVDYIRTKNRDNELFKTFMMWAESERQCQRLNLKDLVVKPMQRLTKYKLLLHAVLKKTEKDDHRRDLVQMIERVDKFVTSVDTAMHQRQEQERLKLIIDRIEGCDFIDAPNEECAKLVSEFCQLDLTCQVPGCSPKQRRHLLCEGPLKLKDPNTKVDTIVFLFTDMLVITKPTIKKQGEKVKVIRPPMRLDKITVHTLKDQGGFALIHLNEYHLASAVYTLHGDAKMWVQEINKAQEKYRLLRRQAMERQDERIVLLDTLEDDEDNDGVMSAVLNSPSHAELEPRQSNSSVETFMPNLSHTASQPALSRLDQSQSENIMLPGQVPEQSVNHAKPERTQSEIIRGSSHDHKHSTVRSSSQPTLVTGSLASIEAAEQLVQGEESPTKTKKQPPPLLPKPKVQHNDVLPSVTSPHGRDPMLVLSNRPDLVFLDDDVRSKLNQRRTSRTEKRYHTADAIQEMQKDRDPSIHKRLSWNFGSTSSAVGEKTPGLLGKAMSSDSLMSMPSSSGVSSTQSLHLCQEDDVIQEVEDSFVGELHVTETEGKIVLHLQDPYQSENSETSTDTVVDEMESLSKPLKITHNPSAIRTKTLSKSLPEIDQLEFQAGEVIDGIGSVEVPKIPTQRRKMTHAQIRQMKKQLLLNYDLEASEV